METNMAHGMIENQGRELFEIVERTTGNKSIFWIGMKFVLRKGDSISFWWNKLYDYKQLSLSFLKTYEITRDKDGSVRSFYRMGTFKIATLRDGDYWNQTERTTIIKKLENNISRPGTRGTPL